MIAPADSASTSAQLAAMLRAVRPRAKARPATPEPAEQALPALRAADRPLATGAPSIGSLKLHELFVRRTAPLF